MPAVTVDDVTTLDRLTQPGNPAVRTVRSVTAAPSGFEGEGFPVAVVCQTLAVSRAGYYAHARGGAGPREQEDARLQPMVRQIFWEHKRRYGARRIAAELAAQGETCGPRRASRRTARAGPGC